MGKFCVIEDGVEIGDGTVLGHNVHIERDVTIGKNCYIGNGCHIRYGCVIGDNTQFRDHCLIEPEARIGNNVMFRNHISTAHHQVFNDNCYIGPHVSFTNANVVRSMTGHKMPIDPPPYLEEGVTVFTHAVVLSGVRLAKGCVVGAGAVVTKDTEPGKTYLGIPARPR